MAITLSQIKTGIRRRSNTVNLFIEDEELTDIANQAVSAAYDYAVDAFAPYFSRTAPFSLLASNSILLDDIVNPAQPIYQPTLEILNDTGTFEMLAFANDTQGGEVSSAIPNPSVFAHNAEYTITSFTVTLLTPTTVNMDMLVNKNGDGTGMNLTIPSGSAGVLTSSLDAVTFNWGDIITITTLADGVNGTSYPITWNIQPVLVNPTFYKETGVDWFNSSTFPVTIPRLDSFQQRNAGGIGGLGGASPGGLGPRSFDIIGDSLVIYPPISSFVGSYQLHYVPSCPVLSNVVDLPHELDRWNDVILLTGAIVVKEKRNMSTAQLEQRLAVRKQEIQAAMKHRAKEPKLIPLRQSGGITGRNDSGYGYT